MIGIARRVAFKVFELDIPGLCSSSRFPACLERCSRSRSLALLMQRNRQLTPHEVPNEEFHSWQTRWLTKPPSMCVYHPSFPAVASREIHQVSSLKPSNC